jgi:hypothetical protein
VAHPRSGDLGLNLSHSKLFQDKWKEMPRKKGQPPGLKFRSERPDVYIDPAECATRRQQLS